MLGYLLMFGWPGIAALVFRGDVPVEVDQGIEEGVRDRGGYGLHRAMRIGILAGQSAGRGEASREGSEAVKQIYGNIKKLRQRLASRPYQAGFPVHHGRQDRVARLGQRRGGAERRRPGERRHRAAHGRTRRQPAGRRTTGVPSPADRLPQGRPGTGPIGDRGFRAEDCSVSGTGQDPEYPRRHQAADNHPEHPRQRQDAEHRQPGAQRRIWRQRHPRRRHRSPLRLQRPSLPRRRSLSPRRYTCTAIP